MALALVGAGLALAAGSNDDGPGRVKVLADPAPSTTAPAPAPDPAPPTTAPAARPTTTVPQPAAVPDRSRPAGMTYTPEAIWPETLAELDKLQAAVDVRRLLNGSIWYVAGSRSAAVPGLEASRRSGSLAVVVQGGADGTLAVRAKRPPFGPSARTSIGPASGLFSFSRAAPGR